ncbi:MAG: TIGR01777 family oxidoreductase [Acidiferrobacterales bacterium]
MNILVTGGTGFIGSALCKRLLAKSHEVAVLTRNGSRAQKRLGASVTAVESLDGLDPSKVPNAIINLAGLSLGSGRWTEGLKRAFLSSRVGTTRRVVEYIAASKAVPEVLISGSAVGYYGARDATILDEDATPGNEYQTELCEAWEAEALKAEAFGTRVCLSRAGVVLGKGGGALSSLLPPFKRGLGGYVGTGRQWMSWIHIADLVAVYLHLIQHECLSGAFNATSPHPVTNREFAKALGATLRRPALMWAPAWVVRALVGEMAHLYLTGQRVYPKRLLESGFEYQYPKLVDALADIVD